MILPNAVRAAIFDTDGAPLTRATAAERSLCVAVVRTMHDVLDCLIAAEAASPV